MDIGFVAGTLPDNAKGFKVNNQAKIKFDVLSDINNNVTLKTSVVLWVDLNQAMAYGKKLTKGTNVFIIGHYMRDMYQQNGQYIHKNNMVVDHLKFTNMKCDMNSFTILGTLNTNGFVRQVGNQYSLFAIVRSPRGKHMDFITLTSWTSNANIANYWKRFAKKGNTIFIPHGEFKYNHYQNKNQQWVDNSSIKNMGDIQFGTSNSQSTSSTQRTQQISTAPKNMFTNDSSQNPQPSNNQSAQPKQSNNQSINQPNNQFSRKNKIHIKKGDLPF